MRYPPAPSPDPETPDSSTAQRPTAPSLAASLGDNRTEASLCQADISLVGPQLRDGFFILRRLIACAKSSLAAPSEKENNGSHDKVWERLFSGGDGSRMSPDLKKGPSEARNATAVEAHRDENENQQNGCEGHRRGLEARPERTIKQPPASFDGEVIAGKASGVSSRSCGDEETRGRPTDSGCNSGVVDHTSEDSERCSRNPEALTKGEKTAPLLDGRALKVGGTATAVSSKAHADLEEDNAVFTATLAGTSGSGRQGKGQSTRNQELYHALEEESTVEGVHVTAAVLEAGAEEGRRLTKIAAEAQKLLDEQASILFG